jgi:DNA-binding PadR family transcriptional regulator
MMRSGLLGPLEYPLLLALNGLGGEDYAIPIVKRLNQRMKTDIPERAIYETLHRLVAKGVLKVRLGEPEAKRGGRARQYYSLTKDGAKRLAATDRALASLKGR